MKSDESLPGAQRASSQDFAEELNLTFKIPVTEALNEAASKVRKFPRLKPAQTTLKHIALHLRANNPKQMLEHNRRERQKQLQKFMMGCDLNEKLVSELKGNAADGLAAAHKQFDALIESTSQFEAWE